MALAPRVNTPLISKSASSLRAPFQPLVTWKDAKKNYLWWCEPYHQYNQAPDDGLNNSSQMLALRVDKTTSILSSSPIFQCMYTIYSHIRAPDDISSSFSMLQAFWMREGMPFIDTSRHYLVPVTSIRDHNVESRSYCARVSYWGRKFIRQRVGRKGEEVPSLRATSLPSVVEYLRYPECFSFPTIAFCVATSDNSSNLCSAQSPFNDQY